MKYKPAVIAAILVLGIGIGFAAVAYFNGDRDSAIASILEGDDTRPPNSVFVTTTWQEDGSVLVSFNINEADAGDVFGAVMNFRYRGSDLEYLSYEEGNYFDQAGTQINQKKPIYLVSDRAVSEDEAGEHRLAVGVSLFKGSPGMKGSGCLIKLKFKPNTESRSQIILTKKRVVNTTAKKIEGISWPAAVQIAPA